MSREVMLRDHLMYNFMPPVPESYDCAVEAINACLEGDFDREIETPSGKMMKASWVISGLKLDFFIEGDAQMIEQEGIAPQIGWVECAYIIYVSGDEPDWDEVGAAAQRGLVHFREATPTTDMITVVASRVPITLDQAEEFTAEFWKKASGSEE